MGADPWQLSVDNKCYN